MSKTEAAALFDQLDTDQSGELDFNELNKALRAGADIELMLHFKTEQWRSNFKKYKFALRTRCRRRTRVC